MKAWILPVLLFLYFTHIASAQTTAAEFIQLGKDNKLQGNNSEALKAFSQAVSLDGQHADALKERAKLYFELKEYSKCKRDANTLIKYYPEHPFGYYTKAKVRLARENLTGALKDLNKTLELNPEFIEARVLRGKVHGSLGHFIEDIVDQTAVLAEDPDNKFAWLERSYAKLKLQDYRGAEKDLDKALEIDPLFVDAYLQRGYVKLLSGNETGAEADMKTGDKLRKQHSQNLAELSESE